MKKEPLTYLDCLLNVNTWKYILHFLYITVIYIDFAEQIYYSSGLFEQGVFIADLSSESDLGSDLSSSEFSDDFPPFVDSYTDFVSARYKI